MLARTHHLALNWEKGLVRTVLLQVAGASLLRETLGRTAFSLLDAGTIGECGDRFTLR